MNKLILLDNYSPAADIVASAICLVMIVLVYFSYINRTRSSTLFLSMVGLVLAASWADIAFYVIAVMPDHQVLANWLRCGYHAVLFLIFVHYIAYMCEVTNYEKQRFHLISANIVFAIVMLADIFYTARGLTFSVSESSITFTRNGVFFFAYACYTLLSLILLSKVRKLVFRRVMFGFYGTILISMGILIMQGLSGQSSFTVTSMLLPVVAMMYVLHSNPYNVMLGTNDVNAMQNMIEYYRKKNKDFYFMSLYMRSFDEEGKEMPDEIQALIRQFAFKFFKNWRMFSVGEGHLILIFLKKQNPNYEKNVWGMIDEFYPLYERFRYDYKIVVGDCDDVISEKNDYANYIRMIQSGMSECSIHKVVPMDIEDFRQNDYILNELSDIYHKQDLDDPRVLVYCQPVLNVRTGQYDTAEALMRLDLEKTGIVYPNKFIPLAEEQNYIHVLTEIILHKTCEAIRDLTDSGYEIKWISVNVSALELKNKDFCRDIMDIIDRSGISGEKVAIELTESRSESDFILMKKKIDELKRNGIKLYLDDFGTGYSNMERILELPFDIIKFDRSMVQASVEDERSRRMVANLASMFSEMNYYVLYEGVEKDSDEDMCKDMSATFLQGFKYSKPAPIEELKEYVSRRTG